MREAGMPGIIGAVGGLIIWAAHFGFIYLANAVACGRGIANRTLLGQPLVPVSVLAATAVTLALLLLIGWRAWRRLRSSARGRNEQNGSRFMAWLTLAVVLLSALAIAWQSLPVLLVPPCA